MSLRECRIAAVAKQLRALAIPGRKRPRAPWRPMHRGGLELEYFTAIKVVPVICARELENTQPHIMHQLRKASTDAGHAAASKAVALDAIRWAKHRAVQDFNDREFVRATHKIGASVDRQHRAHFDRLVERVFGVTFTQAEAPTPMKLRNKRVDASADDWANRNVKLIRSIPDRYFERVAKDIAAAFDSGARAETLAEDLKRDYDIAIDDARRIARDQIGKLAGQLEQERQELIGVEKFVWRTAEDERVRPSHEALDGEEFEWDDLPEDEETGEEISPGSAIQCRCWPDPVLDDMLEDLG